MIISLTQGGQGQEKITQDFPNTRGSFNVKMLDNLYED